MAVSNWTMFRGMSLCDEHSTHWHPTSTQRASNNQCQCSMISGLAFRRSSSWTRPVRLKNQFFLGGDGRRLFEPPPPPHNVGTGIWKRARCRRHVLPQKTSLIKEHPPPPLFGASVISVVAGSTRHLEINRWGPILMDCSFVDCSILEGGPAALCTNFLYCPLLHAFSGPAEQA